MATENRSTVVGVFRDRNQAERAIEALKNVGFRDDQIGYAAPKGDNVATGQDLTTTDRAEGNKAGEGAATGVVLGGLLGAAAALLIPGIGPIVAGGMLATALGGAAVGAAAGGIIGALAGMGIPEEEARYYESEFKSGRTLVTVKAGNRYQEAYDILRRYGAYDMRNQNAAAYTESTQTTNWNQTTDRQRERMAASTADRDLTGDRTNDRLTRTGKETRDVQGDTMHLHEEELHATKRPVQSGEVHVGKEVVEEERTLNVPVTREEVYVERHPVDRRPADHDISAEERSIDVPVMREEVDVEKRPVVTEEVKVGKRQVQENREVTDTVRREEARIEPEGDVNIDKNNPDIRRNRNA